MDSALASTPSVGDFSVSESVNGGGASNVTPTGVTLDSTGKLVTLTVPQIAALAKDQSVLYSVSYQGGPAVAAASAFTVNGIDLSSLTSSITGIPSSTITDGSTLTLTLTAKDASGNAISGLAGMTASLQLTGTSTQTLSSASVIAGASAGQYLLVFNPTNLTSDTSVAANLQIAGVTIPVGTGITIDTASLASTQTASFPSNTTLNAGGTYSITVNLVDVYGNPITGSSLSPSLKLGSGSSAVSLTTGALTAASTPGQYTISFTAPNTINTSAQPLVLTLGTNGPVVTSTSSYTVANVVPANLTASFTGLPSAPLQGGTYTIPVTVSDAGGNPVTGLGSSAFTASATAAASSASSVNANASISSVSAGNQPGQYTVSVVMPTFMTANPTSGSNIATVTVGINGYSAVSATSSEITFGGAAASVAPSASASSVTWPTNTSLNAGQTYTVQMSLKDANGNALVGLDLGSSGAFGSSNGLKLNGSLLTYTSSTLSAGNYSVATGTTPGSYVVSFIPSSASSGELLQVLVNGTAFTAPSTYSIVSGTAVATNATAGSTLPAELVAGQSYTATVSSVEDAATNPVSNLTAGNFGVQLGTTNLPVTSVAATATAGQYNVTFTAPATTVSTGQTLAIYINGATVTSLEKSGVKVANVSGANTTVTSSVSLTSSFPSTTYNSGNVSALTTSGAVTLDAGAYYAIDVAVNDGAGTPNALSGLNQAAFNATLGSSSTNLVQDVAETATPGAYTVVIKAPSSISASSALAVSVAGATVTPAVSATYSIQAGALSASSSSISYPTTTALVAGNPVNLTVTAKDAAGNPLTGLSTTSSNWKVYVGTTAYTSSSLSVTNNNDGTYTIALTPTTAAATAQSMSVQYDLSGTFTTLGTASSSSYTVAAGAFGGSDAANIVAPSGQGAYITAINSKAQTANVSGAGTYTLTLQATDAYGNPIANFANPPALQLTFTSGSGNSNTLSAGATSIGSGTSVTFGANGQLTLTYTVTTAPSTNNDSLVIKDGTGTTTYDTIAIQ